MSYGSVDRYREMDVMAMSPARRLVLLYARLLASLRQARRHLEQGEIEARTERLLHAEEIVRELALSLDHVRGGELAGRLAQLYAWILGQLSAIHIRPDAARLDAVVRIVLELHDAWGAAADQVAAGSGSE